MACNRSSSLAGALRTLSGRPHWFRYNSDTIVEASTTRTTPGAELRIMLDPLASLEKTDFIL